MYDINTKNVKRGLGFYYLFMFVGILLLGIFLIIVMARNKTIKQLDSRTTSIGMTIETSHDEQNTKYSPIYHYLVSGREYSCPSNTSSSAKPGEKNITIYYSSSDPSKCMTEYSKSRSKLIYLFMIVPIVFMIFSSINVKKVDKRLKIINELNQKGKLVKNLNYHLEDTGITINKENIKRPVVEYTLSSGKTVTLYGDPRFDRKTKDEDGTVDLIIDENNPENYFIDFEINRLTGNLPTDYYSQSKTDDSENKSI